jgi:hypothetical protein
MLLSSGYALYFVPGEANDTSRPIRTNGASGEDNLLPKAIPLHYQVRDGGIQTDPKAILEIAGHESRVHVSRARTVDNTQPAVWTRR